MKYVDINKRFTEIVSEYIAAGYTLNTASIDDVFTKLIFSKVFSEV